MVERNLFPAVAQRQQTRRKTLQLLLNKIRITSLLSCDRDWGYVRFAVQDARYSPFRLIEHLDKRSNRLIVQNLAGPDRNDLFISKNDLVYSSKIYIAICSMFGQDGGNVWVFAKAFSCS